MAEKLIFLLAAAAAVLLYLGMNRHLSQPDPTRPPDARGILTAIHESNLACDQIISFAPVGSQKGVDFFNVRCHDGGHYIYMQSPTEGKVGVRTCKWEEANGYVCP